MSTDGGGAQQTGPSRLHVPGQPAPGTPQFRYIVVRDKRGQTFAMPYGYTAAFDDHAAKQIYAVVRQAVADSLRDTVAGIAALVFQAFQPQTDATPAQDDNPDRMCAATLATGMCNERRADHPIEGHDYVPGALFKDGEGIPSLEIEGQPQSDE